MSRWTAAFVLVLVGLLSSTVSALEPASPGRSPVRQSLDEIVLSVGSRVLLILANGEQVRGKVAQAGGDAVSVETEDGLRTLREAEVFQIFQLAERSRLKRTLYGALIGAGVALGAELVFPNESDAPPYEVFALVGVASIPSGALIGAITSGPGSRLVYQNPKLTEPIVTGKLYFHFSGGANLVGGNPNNRGASSHSGTSGNATFEVSYRPAKRWAFGGQLLLANTGTWEWASAFGQGIAVTESRFITAPGFRVHFLPLAGRHEIDFSAGFSAFLQSGLRTQEGVLRGTAFSDTGTSTYLDYFLGGGGSYRYFLKERLAIGSEVEVYEGHGVPKPLVRFSISISVRS